MKDSNLSASALEKKAGLRPSTLHNILLGRVKNPTIESIQSIAKALNCSVSTLIGDESYSFFEVLEKSNEALPWSYNLYIDALQNIIKILSKSKVELTKRELHELIEEIYTYSIKTEKNSVDKVFAEWAISKMIANKR